MSDMDKLEAFFEKVDKRLASMESKLDNRLIKLERKVLQQDKKQRRTENEVNNLRAAVAVLEQSKLELNVLIKGVPEMEENVEKIAQEVLYAFNNKIETKHVSQARRIGSVKADKSRIILVKLLNSDIKLDLMKGLAGKNITCADFTHRDETTWGPKEAKIHISDHLTATMSTIFYHARQLKKNNLVKYAWTKLGSVFVKKDDVSRAFLIRSIDELNKFKNNMDLLDSEDDDDNGETEFDTESEAASKKSGDSKRSRSSNKDGSPKDHIHQRPKRIRSTTQNKKY